MRGFIFGLIWGSIVLALVAAAVSLLAPLPSGPDVRSNAPSSSGQTIKPGTESGMGRAGVDADLVNAAPTLPGASDAPDTLTSMEGADTDSGSRPVVGGDSTLTDPDDGDTTQIETGTTTTAPTASGAPDAPGQGSGAPDDLGSVAQVSTKPPEIDSTTAALTGPAGSETTAGQGAGVKVNSDTPVAPAVPGTAPSAPQSETQLALSTKPAQPIVPSVSGGGSGFGTDAPIEQSTQGSNEGSSDADDSEPQSHSSTLPSSTTLPQAGSKETATSLSIGTPVVPLSERNTTPAVTAEMARVAPIILYSEPFSNPDNKPMMSIILIDDDQAIGVEALANFPQPLTMAIDPSAPDAAEKMARHRAAGFEVVSLINLPKGATAQDAEVALAASFAAMPEVVAVLEGPNSGIQGNRSLADQVSAIVDSTGHGLIMQDNGLNTVFKLAVRAGIPAGVVFRDFDGAGQSGSVIRRFLDQAAFRAGQDGAVIMLGRVRPDTVSALLLWALQDRASRVALAPISAVLNSDQAR